MIRPTPDPAAILAEVQKILDEHLVCEPERATPETTLVILGADSLDAIEIVMEVEEKWAIDITDEELEAVRTVQDIVDAIVRHTQP
jgi:acyl carrier protein